MAYLFAGAHGHTAAADAGGGQINGHETLKRTKARANAAKGVRINYSRQLAAHDFVSLCAGICKILPSLGLIWFLRSFAFISSPVLSGRRT